MQKYYFFQHLECFFAWYLYNLQEIEEFLLFDEHGLVRGFNYQEQIYVIFSYKHSLGVEKLSFSLGLVLILYLLLFVCWLLMFENEVDFVMYCLMSRLIFSMRYMVE